MEIGSSFWRELRLALRRLRRSPGFLVAAVLILGLGIGASAAIFGAIDVMLLEPLVPDEDRVYVLYERRTEAALTSELSLPHVHDWRAMARSFTEMAAFGPAVGRSSLFFPDGDAIEVETARVSPTFFRTLGVAPFLGRGFRLEEDELEAERVVVLSYDSWQQSFGGDPDVLGHSVVLEQAVRARHTVIGVMPRGFDFPGGARIWTPLRKVEPFWPGRGFQFLFAVGRLAPGVSIETAQSELDTLIPEIYRDHDLPQSMANRSHAVPIVDFVLGENTREALLILSSAVGLLFLIACVNVASLFLAQSLRRRRETAILTALGASRSRLARTFPRLVIA